MRLARWRPDASEGEPEGLVLNVLARLICSFLRRQGRLETESGARQCMFSCRWCPGLLAPTALYLAADAPALSSCHDAWSWLYLLEGPMLHVKFS